MKFEDIELNNFYKSDVDKDKTYYFFKKENEYGVKPGFGYVSPTSDNKQTGDNYIIFVLWRDEPILIRREVSYDKSSDFISSLYKIKPKNICFYGCIKTVFSEIYNDML